MGNDKIANTKLKNKIRNTRGKIRRAFAQGVSDHEPFFFNSIFSLAHIFKQKLEQLLQHVFEQLFLARTILDSGCLSGSLLAGR